MAGFQGLKHFGVIGGDTPKDTEIEEKRKTSKAGLNTRNARGQVKNINSTLPQDVQVARKNQLAQRLPNVDAVLGSDSAMWLEVLNEEDFTILRELRNKLNLNQDITEEDLKHFVMLENRQVIQAIRENRPSLLKGGSAPVPDPVQENPPEEEQPSYQEPDPEPVPEQSPEPQEEAPLQEDGMEPESPPMDSSSEESENQF